MCPAALLKNPEFSCLCVFGALDCKLLGSLDTLFLCLEARGNTIFTVLRHEINVFEWRHIFSALEVQSRAVKDWGAGSAGSAAGGFLVVAINGKKGSEPEGGPIARSFRDKDAGGPAALA